MRKHTLIDVPTPANRRHTNAAHTALEHARRRRRVLIVTRTVFQASDVFDVLQDALSREDMPSTSRRGNGLWHVVSSAWGGGRIDVRVQGAALRGRSADTVLRHGGLSRAALRDCRIIAHASAAPFVGDW